MIIYENELSTFTFPLLRAIFPVHVRADIAEILETASISPFYCKVEGRPPNVNVYKPVRHIETSLCFHRPL